MYPGSNLLEIVKFLKATHSKQNFSFGPNRSTLDVCKNSILNGIFPDALIFYLTNYSAENFLKVYLSDIKSPEVIWNSEMR